MTRDDAIRVGIFALAAWHRQDHAEQCICLEGEQFGAQMAAVVYALAAVGVQFDDYDASDRGPRGAPVVGEG